MGYFKVNEYTWKVLKSPNEKSLELDPKKIKSKLKLDTIAFYLNGFQVKRE